MWAAAYGHDEIVQALLNKGADARIKDVDGLTAGGWAAKNGRGNLAMLLREAGEPLHVNEIYNRLMEGGFNFTGHNPTISIAVSLNRNGRFRKVAPGTFDLVMREASRAS